MQYLTYLCSNPLGNPPADWWGDSEDRDLLLGICKHGYQQ